MSVNDVLTVEKRVMAPPDFGVLAREPGRLRDWYKAMKVTVNDPVMALPSAGQVVFLLEHAKKEELIELLNKREKLIQLRKMDPFNYCWQPQMWRDADALLAGTYCPPATSVAANAAAPQEPLSAKKAIGVIGGNRSTKSNWFAHRTMKLQKEKEGHIAWCLTTDASVSIRDQQAYIWHYTPAEWRALEGTRTQRTYIAYKKKTGFSDASVIWPNGSSIQFMNYEMAIAKIEGGQIDWWWGNEFLPCDWQETLEGRTVDRKGQGGLDQTPINGFNMTMGRYVDKGRVVAWIDAVPDPEFLAGQLWPGGEPGKVPYVMESSDPRYAAIFFDPRQNVFIDFRELYELWARSGKETKLIRWHGVTLKKVGNIFPGFGSHNVVKHEKIPEEGTNYHLIDFAWDRPWFMVWVRVWEHKGKKRIYLYREWPDFLTYGEWSLPSENDLGKRGPAQTSLGMGWMEYKAKMLQSEGWIVRRLAPAKYEVTQGDQRVPELIFTRYGDPKSGNAADLQEEGASSFLFKLAEATGGLPAVFVQGWAGSEGSWSLQERVDGLNDWLKYDNERPIDIENEPMFFVSDRCQNVINAFRDYKGKSLKEAAKDPIDCLGGAALMKVSDMSVAVVRGPRRFGGGY
jgi:hypothetical protein